MKNILLLQTDRIKKTKEIADLFTRLNTNNNKVSSAYLLDISGIEKNRPTLSLHQYTHRWFDTIVDAGCHHIGDVVDSILAGANIVVIRPDLWEEPDFRSIRDISQTHIYIWYDPLKKNNENTKSPLLTSEPDGIIFYADHLEAPLSFDIREKLKTMISIHGTKNVFVFDSLKKHEKEWNQYGMNTLIVDKKKIEESL